MPKNWESNPQWVFNLKRQASVWTVDEKIGATDLAMATESKATGTIYQAAPSISSSAPESTLLETSSSATTSLATTLSESTSSTPRPKVNYIS